MTISQKVSSIGEIRTHLAGVIKTWNQQTCDLSWPENDSSMAAMDTHIRHLRSINAQLAVIENRSPIEQQSLAVHFDEDCVQDPYKFARFAEAVQAAA